MFLAAAVILLVGLPARAAYADVKITQRDIDEGVAISREFPVSLQVDGEKVESEVPPVIVKERTLIPARAVFESMGADVFWNEDARLVEIALGTFGGKAVHRFKYRLVNGAQAFRMFPH